MEHPWSDSLCSMMQGALKGERMEQSPAPSVFSLGAPELFRRKRAEDDVRQPPLPDDRLLGVFETPARSHEGEMAPIPGLKGRC
jgi:hypothetical protein